MQKSWYQYTKMKSRVKIFGLAITGILIIASSIVIGKVLLLDGITLKLKEIFCVDSISHKSYKTWAGDATNRPKNQQIKAYFWNLTNKEDFLYNGADPSFKEVGPYVYTFGVAKMNPEFSTETYKYQSLMQTQYDKDLTKELCPKCEQDDKITVVNLGYIGTCVKFNGDTNLAYGFIPGVTSQLLNQANNITGSRSNTMRMIGKKGDTIFPANSFPQDWRIEFSLYLNDLNETATSPVHGKIKSINFTETEMEGLYNVITNATLLGVAAQALPTRCNTDPIHQECLDAAGFLYLSKVNIALNSRKIMGAIQKLFCPNNVTMCLQLDADLTLFIASYVTTHLAKMAIDVVVDNNDYGIVTTKTQRELASGWVMTKLAIPGVYPNGLPVPGYLKNDSDINEAMKTNEFTEYYKCNLLSKKELSWAAYGGRKSTPRELFINPNASDSFLLINGKYQQSYFGYKRKMEVCQTKQMIEKTSYEVYDSLLRSSFTIKRVGSSDYESIHVHNFEVDPELFAVNNITVFTKGLVDLTNTKQGIPFLISAPHFMHSQDSLKKKLKMNQLVDKYKSVFNIEPISGAPTKVQYRLQINTIIPENVIQAPRLRPFNLTYKESNAPHYSNPVPLVWIEYHIFASEEQLTGLATVKNVLQMSCGILIAGPLIGCIFMSSAVYVFWKRWKKRNEISDSVVFNNSTSSKNQTV